MCVGGDLGFVECYFRLGSGRRWRSQRVQYKALQRVRVAGCRVQGAGCTDLGLRHRDREVGLERVERIGTQHAKLVGCR